MILVFGPAGSGKSVQGQIIAARKEGWRWLSMGELLRDTHDEELYKIMQKGGLVPSEKTNQIIDETLEKSDKSKIILDGYPRNLEQAKWLFENQSKHGESIDLVIVLEVPLAEIEKRLQLRGRADDKPEAIKERLMLYRKQIYPILNYLTEQGVHIAHIDGTGTVGQIHDRIMDELVSCNLGHHVG
jgi:adenylate kinase